MKSVLKHASVYGLANLLLQVGQFLLLPLYLRCLSPGEYGLLQLVTNCAETVGTVLLFGGFRQALMTFYQQADGDEGRLRVVSSALTLYGVMAVVGGGLVIWLAGPACLATVYYAGEKANGLTPEVARLALLCMLLEPFVFVPHTLLQARVESKKFLLVQVSHFLLRVALCIVLIRYCRLGVAGALLATLAAAVVMGTWLTARELLRGITWPDRRVLVGLLAFALPLMPGGLCFFMLHQGDRLFLLGYVSQEELGIYALGYTLAAAVGRFAFVPLYMVWSAQMYEAAKRPDAAAYFGQTFARLLGVYALTGLGVCLVGREIVLVLGGAKYAAAATYIGPVFLGCLFQGTATLFDAGFYIHRKTAPKLAITLFTTVVMIALYAVLIPAYGAMGAALATVLGFLVLAALTCVVSHYLLPVEMPWVRLAGMLALGVGIWALANSLPQEGLWSLGTRAALGPAAVLVAWASGLISREEKRDALDLVRSLRRRLLPVPARTVPAAGEPAGTVSSPAA